MTQEDSEKRLQTELAGARRAGDIDAALNDWLFREAVNRQTHDHLTQHEQELLRAYERDRMREAIGREEEEND